MVISDVTQEIVHMLAMTWHSFGTLSKKYSPSSFAAKTKQEKYRQFDVIKNKRSRFDTAIV